MKFKEGKKMTTGFFKNTTIAAVTVATLATAMATVTVSPADAGKRDFWGGVAAGVVGSAIVGGAIHRDRRYRDRRYRTRRVSAWEAHVDWCYDNRPRYRERDNTYRRSGQGRRTCYSPYYD